MIRKRQHLILYGCGTASYHLCREARQYSLLAMRCPLPAIERSGAYRCFDLLSRVILGSDIYEQAQMSLASSTLWVGGEIYLILKTLFTPKKAKIAIPPMNRIANSMLPILLGGFDSSLSDREECRDSLAESESRA